MVLGNNSRRILMCPPDFYGVAYTINSFMMGNIGKVDRELAKRQWNDLHEAITSTGVEIDIMTPHAQPDLVFTANAGYVWGQHVIPARFTHLERQGEEPFYQAWFFEHGYTSVELEPGEAFEGEGDVVTRSDCLFMGHGSRTSLGARHTLAQATGMEVVPLKLDPEGFYHLDTCLVSQGKDGAAFYYPGAFEPEGREAIQQRIPPARLFPVTREEALCFACNMLIVEDTAIYPTAPPSFAETVRAAGLQPVMVELSEFMKAGGAAKCLSLWLER